MGDIHAPGTTSKHWTATDILNLHRDNEQNSSTFLIQVSDLERNFTPQLVSLFSAARHLLYPGMSLFSTHPSSLLHRILLCSPCALLSVPIWGTTCEYFLPTFSFFALCNIIVLIAKMCDLFSTCILWCLILWFCFQYSKWFRCLALDVNSCFSPLEKLCSGPSVFMPVFEMPFRNIGGFFPQRHTWCECLRPWVDTANKLCLTC